MTPVPSKLNENALEDGEVFRWHWADEKRDADRGPYRSYHCKSQLAVVRGGRLYDTYWSIPSYNHELDRSAVILEPYANESWATIRDYEVPYYDPKDVRSMRHSNSSSAPIYLRPGAVRSKDAILTEIQFREDNAKSQIRMAEWRLQELAKAREHAEAGRLEEVRL